LVGIPWQRKDKKVHRSVAVCTEKNRREGGEIMGEHDQIPALPDLFLIEEDGARLMSARCKSCSTYFFPRYHEQHRPECPRSEIDNVLLSKEGKLTSYTIQHYMPPPPFRTDAEITPFAIGLVEFPEEIQVVGIISDCSFDQLTIGMDMETTTFALYWNEEGQKVVTWAFRPLVLSGKR